MGSLTVETPHSEVTATLEWLDRLGVTREDLKTLRKAPDHIKADLVTLLGGNVIDCNAPAETGGYDADSVISHVLGGKLVFTPATVELYKSPEKVKGIELVGLSVRRQLNINVLRFLLRKPFLIPEEWRDGRRIYFLGTLYRGFYGGTHAAYLQMVGRGDLPGGRHWDTKVTWLEGNDFLEQDYVAVSKA